MQAATRLAGGWRGGAARSWWHASMSPGGEAAAGAAGVRNPGAAAEAGGGEAEPDGGKAARKAAKKAQKALR